MLLRHSNPLSYNMRLDRMIARAMLVLIVSASSLAQAQRSFQMGFTPFPPTYDDYGYYRAYTFLAQHADVISHPLTYGVPWNEALLSSDPTTYPVGLQNMWAFIHARDQLFVPAMDSYIEIQPINYQYLGLAEYWNDQTNQPLPYPWNTYNFDDPRAESAFLNYAIAVVNYFHPKYLAVGVEVNILLARDPFQWTAYKSLNHFIYVSLKARFPDLTIFPTIQYEHMLGYQHDSAYLAAVLKSTYPDVLTAEVADLMQSSDAFTISTYPYMTAGLTIQPNYYGIAEAMASALGKPVAVDQTGYTSQTISPEGVTLYGTPDIQNLFVSYLLMQAYENGYKFVINYIPIDYAANYGDTPVAQTWAYTGLADSDDQPKPGLATWDAFRSVSYSPGVKQPRNPLIN